MTLGGARRLASLQLNRTGEWYLILIEEGGNVHEGQAVPMRVFRRGGPVAIGGVEHALTEGMDWEREVERRVGNRRIGLRFDEENRIIVRGLPQAP